MCRQQMTDEHEQWDIERAIERMERDVERGSAMQQILRAERLAAIRGNTESNEQELDNVVNS